MNNSNSAAETAKIRIRRFGDHRNAFGFLRLFLASAVIFSHAPQLVDGSLRREIIYQASGTIEAGSLAVIGFFVISGYLITGSYLSSSSWKQYVVKRIARIYPAFIVTFWTCIFIFAPIGGGKVPGSLITIIKRAFDSLALQVPWVPNAFAGTPYPALDGSLWTISYEFRCYLLVLVLGWLGILRHRYIVLVAAFTLVAATCMFVIPIASATPPIHWSGIYLNYAFGEPLRVLRLVAAFSMGCAAYLFRDKLIISWWLITIALAGFLAGMLSKDLVIATSIVFGGYLVFATASKANILKKINNRSDISYGVYLYAWPVTKVINYYHPRMHPFYVAIVTLLISIGFGWASWLLIEKPAMGLVRRLLSRRAASEVIASERE